MTALADQGYFEGEQVLACEAAGIKAMVPKPDTSSARARGQWGKGDFRYEPETDTYLCPMGQQLQNRFTAEEKASGSTSTSTKRLAMACSATARCTTARQAHPPLGA